MGFSKKFDTKSNFLFFRTENLEKFLERRALSSGTDTGGRNDQQTEHGEMQLRF